MGRILSRRKRYIAPPRLPLHTDRRDMTCEVYKVDRHADLAQRMHYTIA